MARQKIRFLLGCGLLLASLPLSAEELRARVLYGRHSDFWKEVKALEKKEDPTAQVKRFLDQKSYGSREGVVLADFKLLSEAPDYFGNYFNKSSLGFGFHALAGGEAYNRIAPKIRGYTLWDLSFDAELSHRPEPDQSGWTSVLGSSLGIGRQKLVQGEASDFFSKVPVQNSTLFYSGFDLGLGYESLFSERLQMHYLALVSPTFYYAEIDRNQYTYAVHKRSRSLRWRTEYESTFLFQPRGQGGAEMGGQVFTGQQPIPVRIVPRTWDAVHRIETFPVLGSLIGAGVVARFFNASRHFLLQGYGGFYGGYFGGGGSLNLSWFRLEGGSFGLEQTSGYRVRQSRIEYLSAGVHYEW